MIRGFFLIISQVFIIICCLNFKNLSFSVTFAGNLKKIKSMKTFLQLKNISRAFLVCFALLGVHMTSWAQFSVAAGSTNYTQNFNTLTSGTWTDGTTLTGWYAKTDATASITAYAANTGSTTGAGLYALGVAGTNPLTDRALGY